MYENESAAVRAGIDFLQANLPVEAIDDDEEREDEYPGDFEDSEELEDEVVECEKLIAQAKKLIAAVKEHYLPSDVSLDAVSPAPSPGPIQTTLTAPIQAKTKKKRDIDWTFLWLVFIIGILIAGAILS